MKIHINVNNPKSDIISAVQQGRFLILNKKIGKSIVHEFDTIEDAKSCFSHFFINTWDSIENR